MAVAKPANGGVFVTYRQFVTWMLSAAALFVTLGVALASLHASRPHADAVHRDEYTKDHTDQQARLGRIEDKIDKLLDRK